MKVIGGDWIIAMDTPDRDDLVDAINFALTRYVACERCGGSGEVEVRPTVGPYDDPTPCAVLCSACDGYGMDCVETEPIEMDDLDDGSK